MNSVHLLATFWPPFGFGEKSPDKMQTASGHRLAGVGRRAKNVRLRWVVARRCCGRFRFFNVLSGGAARARAKKPY